MWLWFRVWLSATPFGSRSDEISSLRSVAGETAPTRIASIRSGRSACQRRCSLCLTTLIERLDLS